jgi:Ca2+-binding RTX toxin-like protein
MTIDVRGTKTTGNAVNPAERYAQKDLDRLSAVPKVLALAFIGVALYLKSIFPVAAVSAGGAAEKQGKAGQDDPAAGPAAESLVSGARQDTDARPAAGKTDEADGSADPTTGAGQALSYTVIRLTDISHRVERLTLDSPAITVQPDLGGLFKLALISNENGAPAADTPIGRSAPVNTTAAAAGTAAQDDSEDDDPVDDIRLTPNRPPRIDGTLYLHDVIGASVLLIGLADLLRHSVDPDGDQLSVTEMSVSSGTLSTEGIGWAFQATGDYTMPVVISYTITDGEFEVSQTAHLMAIRPWVQGTDRADLLIGTTWSDDISGEAGDDNIDGRQGNDVISGGSGDDHILGGSGHDTIFGGAGNDILLGQEGNDHLFGNSGDDKLFGGAGEDLLVGGQGADMLDGGVGADFLEGGDGDDLLDGGAGDDVLLDGAGIDTVFGGAGNDVVLAEPDAADDWFSGGEGFDTIDYSRTTEGVMIDLNQELASGAEVGTDVINNFEKAIGGAGNDYFIVGTAPKILSGGAGENTFEFVPVPTSDLPVQVRHEITDFKYGDKVKMSHYKLFDEVFDEMEDEFESMYGDDIDDDDIPIRIRQDLVEDMRMTIIEADLNRDDVFETTVFIQGHHVLVITDTTA